MAASGVDERLELENAIERVRAEALSMRESDDLKKVLAVAFRELRTRGIDLTGFMAMIYDEAAGLRSNYLVMKAPDGWRPPKASEFELLDADLVVGGAQMRREEIPESSYERWRKGEIVREHLDNRAYRKHVEFVNSVLNLDFPMPLPGVEEFLIAFPFAQGEFAAGSERAFSDEEVTVLGQFAEAATIGYQRYLDFVSLEEANRQIQEATRHKSEFLARMSHDLRTPMNAIIGYTRILLRRTKQVLDERQYQNLENIQTSADNLLMLINDVLDLSRIEAGRMDVNPETVDVARLVQECTSSIETLLKPGVNLVHHLNSATPLRTDPDRLRRVVMNLLSNALKFTEAGTITVTLREEEESHTLSVADTGVGIAAEDLPHVFEEFHQVEEAGGKREGSGLGLAIARRMVELLGGEIDVESEVGKGTTFTLRLTSIES